MITNENSPRRTPGVGFRLYYYQLHYFIPSDSWCDIINTALICHFHHNFSSTTTMHAPSHLGKQTHVRINSYWSLLSQLSEYSNYIPRNLLRRNPDSYPPNKRVLKYSASRTTGDHHRMQRLSLPIAQNSIVSAAGQICLNRFFQHSSRTKALRP